MRGRRESLGARTATLVALALLACLVGASSAHGAGYVFKETFGESAQPAFLKPMTATVDPASGDLLVIDEQAKTISRFNPDGSPHDFSALGGNVIDGVAGPDHTPQNGLEFSSNPNDFQVAIAPPGAAAGTAGDIYVTQRSAELVDVFAPSGAYLGQLTEFKEGAGAAGPLKALKLAVGVAVDAAGAVYVSSSTGPTGREIHKYLPAANPVTNADNVANFARPSFGHLAAGAGATAGSIYSAGFGSQVAKLDATTGTQQCLITPGESVSLASSAETGHLFNAGETGEVKEYEGSCGAEPEEALRSFAPGPGINGIAVDGPSGDVYVSRQGQTQIEVWEPVLVPSALTLAASPVGATSATLRGEVNPNGEPLTECAFEWGESAAYGNLAPCEAPDAAEVGEGTSPVAVHADVDLEPGTTYHFQLIVANANNAPGEVIEGGDQQLKSAGPQVRGEEAYEVTATTARIGARIDPNGEETGFFVQYLSEAAYQANPEADRFAGAARVPLSDRQIPATVSGSGDVEAGSLLITGAIASAGAFGPGQTITGPGIQAGTTIVSMPTPTQLQLSKETTLTTEDAAISASGPQPVSQLLSGLAPLTAYRFRVLAENGAAASEGAGGALATFALPGTTGPCANEALRAGFSASLPDCRAYEMVSPSLKAGEVVPPEPAGELSGSCDNCLPGTAKRTQPAQSTAAGETVLYSGQPFGGGLAAGFNEYLGARGAGGWAAASQSPAGITGYWEAFSEDLSRGILGQSDPPLAPAAPAWGGEAFANLYLQVGGGPFQALLTAEPPARDPEHFRIRYGAANAGTSTVPAFSHVALEANDALTGAIPGVAPAAPAVAAGQQCTVSPCNVYGWSGGQLGLVNVAPGNGAAVGEAVIGSGRLLGVASFEYEAPNTSNAISADGRRVFWSSAETGHVYARVDGAKTLEIPGAATCKESVAAGSRACFLTASADGTAVLLADGVIYELAGSGEGEAYLAATDLSAGKGGFEGILGAAADLGRVYFVDSEVLSGEEENANNEKAVKGALNLYAWAEGAPTRFIGRLAAGDDSIGNSGRYGAWHAAPSDRTAQVSGDGRYLAFMSRAELTGYENTRAGGEPCSLASSAGPVCFEVFEYAAGSGKLACASCNPSGQRPLGKSNLSLVKPGAGSPAFRQPGNLSAEGNGRLFFESQDALVPQDQNGQVQDVYQWEPQGVGDCAKAEGCVRLISSGSSPNDSMFLDSSASGDDAFFITRQRLVPSDEDSQLDLYDARVGGGFAEAAGPAGCGGEGCRAPLPAAPTQPSGGSQSYAGPGNPPAAKQKAKHKHKKKHKKHKKHKRAATHDRGGRR